MKKTFSRALSVILAVLMLAVSAPLVFATEPVALTATNVTEWPTTSGEIWFGQKLSDGITISGGTVTSDGTEAGTIIPGKFEFIDPDYCSNRAGDAIMLGVRFVPDDTQNYKGFEVISTDKVTCVVKKVIPVLADPNNPPVATEVASAGTLLGKSMLSGGQLSNPYAPNETTISKLTWSWVNRREAVTQSGYYEAQIGAGGYEVIKMMVYVRIAGTTPETVITETPTIPELTYDGITTWSDVKLLGGKAIINGTDTEIEGNFTFTDSWKDKVLEVGTYNVGVIFTPSDLTQASVYRLTIPVTVNKGTVKFVDESGEEIVPEITLPYGFKVGDDLNGYLKEYLNVSASFNYTETEGYGELIVPGTHEYEVKTSSSDKNFEGTTLKFKVTVNQAELELKVKDVVGGKQIYIEGGDTYHLNGNFDVKYFIDGKESGTIEGVKFNETFEVKQDKSGVYTYEIVYNEAENDPYKVTKVTAAADDIKLQHNVKVVGLEPVTYKYGDTVTINAPAHEKPYYEFTGWANESGITLTDEQRSAESISTIMPDNDIELEATYKFNFSLFIKYIFDVICSWFAKIAAFITGAFAA